MTTFTASERRKASASGASMKNGSYPIYNAKDVENAWHDYYRTGKSSAVKSHILRRAKAIGATHALPSTWHQDGKGSEPTQKGLRLRIHISKALTHKK